MKIQKKKKIFFFQIGIFFFSNWEKSHLIPIGKGAEFRSLKTKKKSLHVYDYTLNSCRLGIKLPRYLYIHLRTTWLLNIVYSYYVSGQ